MTEAATYLADDALRDGRKVTIRALKPRDQTDLEATVSRVSSQSLYRRFFTVKRNFSERDRQLFLDVDFINHVALVALVDENGSATIAGGGRYIVVQPGSAEVAFLVIDDYQGQGLGTALLRHLIAIAREAGLRELVAEVLPENRRMLEIFEKSGLATRTARKAGVVHVVMRLG